MQMNRKFSSFSFFLSKLKLIYLCDSMQYFLVLVSKFESYLALSLFNDIDVNLSPSEAMSRFCEFDFGDADTYRIIQCMMGNPKYNPNVNNTVIAKVKKVWEDFKIVCKEKDFRICLIDTSVWANTLMEIANSKAANFKKYIRVIIFHLFFIIFHLYL
jgi:hypothetical protein